MRETVPTQDAPTAVVPAEPPAILAALWSIMNEVTSVAKGSQYSEGTTRYKFRSIDDLVNDLGKAARTQGVFVQSEDLDFRMDRDRTTRSGAKMTTVSVLKRFKFTSLVDGSTLSFDARGEGSDTADKATMKANTMALKSALGQAFMLPTDEKDPDIDRPESADTNEQMAAQAQARQRAAREQQTGGQPAEGGTDSASKRQRFVEWVAEQLHPHTGEPTTLRKVAGAYWHAHQRNMLLFETDGGVPLEHRIRAALANFVADPRGQVPTVAEIDARAQGGQ